MDIDAADWNRELLTRCILPVSLTLLIIILVLLLAVLNKSRQKLRNQYLLKNKLAAELQESLNHVKRLEGLLPICSYCKKIRDRKGHWIILESYIENHSNAQFSHGLCEECMNKLYKNLDF